MREAALVILIHQLLDQGMFFVKNIALRHKLGRPIRGYNPKASWSIVFFICLVLLGANLLIGLASLRDLGDSWRVGVIEEQQTTLVESGIYRFSHNPCFVAYLLMFAAYAVLLQNLYRDTCCNER